MKELPHVVKKFFIGADLMISDWSLSEIEKQLNWMLYETNRQRDELELQAGELIEAIERVHDCKDEERERDVGLYKSHGSVRSLL